jgi:hypothetical protein
MRCLMDKVYQEKHAGLVLDFVHEASSLIPGPTYSLIGCVVLCNNNIPRPAAPWCNGRWCMQRPKGRRWSGGGRSTGSCSTSPEPGGSQQALGGAN